MTIFRRVLDSGSESKCDLAALARSGIHEDRCASSECSQASLAWSVVQECVLNDKYEHDRDACGHIGWDLQTSDRSQVALSIKTSRQNKPKCVLTGPISPSGGSEARLVANIWVNSGRIVFPNPARDPVGPDAVETKGLMQIRASSVVLAVFHRHIAGNSVCRCP